MIEALVISRWIHFAAVFALFGAPLFWFWSAPWPADPGGLPRSLRATILLVRAAAPIAAISGLAWIIEIIANMAGGFGAVADPAILRAFFFETQFGPVVILRLALLAGVVVAAFLPVRASFPALVVGSALLLIDQAWLGHAAEGGASFYGALMILAYSVHVLAAAAWIGALVPLVFALIERWRSGPQHARGRSLALLSRFSLMGTLAVSLIIVSGLANVAFRVGGSPGNLLHGPYGAVLFAKLLLVAAMLSLAYFNRFVAMPRLRAESPKETVQIARLRTSIGVELGIGILVIAAAALLGITPPPH